MHRQLRGWAALALLLSHDHRTTSVPTPCPVVPLLHFPHALLLGLCQKATSSEALPCWSFQTLPDFLHGASTLLEAPSLYMH